MTSLEWLSPYFIITVESITGCGPIIFSVVAEPAMASVTDDSASKSDAVLVGDESEVITSDGDTTFAGVVLSGDVGLTGDTGLSDESVPGDSIDFTFKVSLTGDCGLSGETGSAEACG